MKKMTGFAPDQVVSDAARIGRKPRRRTVRQFFSNSDRNVTAPAAGDRLKMDRDHDHQDAHFA